MTHVGTATRHWPVRLGVLAVVVAATSLPARADVTVFAAAQSNAGPHPVVGVAFGRAPGSRRVQLYAIGGLGFWGEQYENARGTGAIEATNLGGGVKLPMTGRLRVRVDYRLFILGAAETAPDIRVRGRRHRIAAGLSFTF